jgi:hypothetical protein
MPGHVGTKKRKHLARMLAQFAACPHNVSLCASRRGRCGAFHAPYFSGQVRLTSMLTQQ